MTAKTYQIRVVRTQEQWVEVQAADAQQAQILAQQAIWDNVPAIVKCYAVRLLDSNLSLKNNKKTVI